MSPDTVSSLFPDRPIRPLPKRRLRERLSPELADSIKYPPSTHAPVPLFQYPPYTLKEDYVLKEDGASSRGGSNVTTDQTPRSESTRNYTPRRNGAGIATREDAVPSARSTLVTRSTPEILHRPAGRLSRSEYARQGHPQPPPSTSSSIDGYDSFENASNKKKRKIPSAGDSSFSGPHGLSGDVASHSISTGALSPNSDLHGERSYHGAGSGMAGSYATNNHGISGSGRGRLGRSRNGRSPLRTLSDGGNTWVGRVTRQSAPQWASSDYEGSGIISNAIANAEKLPAQGQENVSLLQQRSIISKATPASSQFTFTCDSQVPGTLQWPGHSSKGSSQTGLGHPASTHHGSNMDGPRKPSSRDSLTSRRKSRQQLEKDLKIAARERRNLAFQNFEQTLPKSDDVWICEFCEYERIFGQPPRALIRVYELKDRRVRQEEADRKRLLEKAKAKARKGKRGSKAPIKGSSPHNPVGDHHPHEELNADVVDVNNGEYTQSEGDYGDDDYPSPRAQLRPPAAPSIEAGGGHVGIPMQHSAGR